MSLLVTHHGFIWTGMINNIRACFENDRIFYSAHARNEMELEERGEIREIEVHEAVLSGKIIETYPEDTPYPSCLVYGRTSSDRPLHVVCAWSVDENLAIIVTVYEPNPDLWVDFLRRRL